MDVNISVWRKVASGVVLFVLTLERLAYYALVSTFYLFLNKGPWGHNEGWDSLDALNAVFILLGVSYISALVGGYASDAWMGRYRAIILGFLLYILGYILLILITVDKLPRYICSGAADAPSNLMSSVNVTSSPVYVDESSPQAPCKAIVYVAIVVLGFGVGFIKANIGPFGAEQLGPSNPALTRSFFNWYYWCTNVGSFVGIGVLSYIEQDNPGMCHNGFFCGYFISTACLGLALATLICLVALFERQPASGNSPLLNIIRITWLATKIKCRDLCKSTSDPPPLVQPKFLDLAKVRYGGRFHETAVDDVRSVGSMMALFASLLPYWLVYFQMQTSFQAQGLHMRFMIDSGSSGGNSNNSASFLTPLDSSATSEDDVSSSYDLYSNSSKHDTTFSIPAAWLTLFNQIFLIIALPVLTKFVYPYLDRRGIRLSMLARIGFGMFISCLAVFTAGGLETFRTVLWRTDNSSHINQTVGNVTYNAVDISIFWQVPQYVLVAAAEAFASIAGLEYAYSEAPRSFQSLVMGLFYAMEGVGSFLGIALLQMIAPFWLSNMLDYANINDNHLDYYLYFLGVIQMVTLIVYGVTIYVSRFTLELVPLRSDEGIGGPLDGSTRRRRRAARSNRANGASSSGRHGNSDHAYRRLEDDAYEARLRHDQNDAVVDDVPIPPSPPPIINERGGSNASSGGGNEHERTLGGSIASSGGVGSGNALPRIEQLVNVTDPPSDSDDSVTVNDTTGGIVSQSPF